MNWPGSWHALYTGTLLPCRTSGEICQSGWQAGAGGARAVRRAAQHNELASARGNNCIRHRLGSYLSGDVVLEIWDLFQPELHDLIHCTDELRGLGALDTVPVGQAERLDWSMSMAVVGR